MPTIEFDEMLRRLERTLVNEGGRGWRRTILEGEAAEVAWPADLPTLAPDLKTWFAWRPTSGDGSPVESWRSASWAAEQYRTHATSPSYRKSLVPVLEGYFIDVDDGSVWLRDFDDEGLDRFERASLADFSELLASVERQYDTRRLSPWRLFRVDRKDRSPAVLLKVQPDLASLARMPAGAVLLAAPASGRRSKGQFLLKIEPSKWLAKRFRAPVPFEDSCVDFELGMLRYDFATGNEGDELQADLTDEAVAEKLASVTAKGPVDLHGSVLRIWRQPPVSDLLARLDRGLMRVAPHVRRALAPPATYSALATLEADIGAPLPAALRSIWAFADGQTAQVSLYWGYCLASVAKARSTIAMMMGLAANQFGEAYWHRAFVPLLESGDGDCLCVDLAGVYGPEGCIVDFDHEWPERRQILFGSLTEWLECFVDGLEAGIYVLDPEGGIYPRDFLETGSFEKIAHHNEVRTNDRYPWERYVRLRPGSTSRS